jgi:hypothetical protein
LGALKSLALKNQGEETLKRRKRLGFAEVFSVSGTVIQPAVLAAPVLDQISVHGVVRLFNACTV